jgi:hypothetical protein
MRGASLSRGAPGNGTSLRYVALPRANGSRYRPLSFHLLLVLENRDLFEERWHEHFGR